jgi:ubiquitin-protein ligase
MYFCNFCLQDLKLLQPGVTPGCSARLDGNNMFKWIAEIEGPVRFDSWLIMILLNPTLISQAQTPYAGLRFSLSITFRMHYPLCPPTVRFITNIYHPNVDDKGHICMDILTKAWSPVLMVYSGTHQNFCPHITVDFNSSVLLSIISLLDDPNVDEPLNADSAGVSFIPLFASLCSV